MEQIFLVGFLPDSNRNSCELNPFGCGRSLVINWDDYCMGMVLWLHMMVRDELACYTICNNGADGCPICLTSLEFVTGENGVSWLHNHLYYTGLMMRAFTTIDRGRR